jgi:predicted nucleic acid-binding protein
MIFVDTGAWYALAMPADPDHALATRFIAQNRARLVTSDYVVDELLTLFVVRRQRTRGVTWIRDVLEGGSTGLFRIERADFEAACRLYERFTDKAWSFTDCTSYILVQRLGISTAFSFDEHFRQFGICSVVP